MLANALVVMPFLNNYLPAKVYSNFYEDRSLIRKNHQEKVSGIYLFFNLQDVTKCYVGQSSNIIGRFNNYLNNSFLQAHKNSNAPFIKALLKYGQSGFGVIILEYVPVRKLSEREIYWIFKLDPYYNVTSGGVTGSTGFLHTQETKDLLRENRLGTKHSKETKALISNALSGLNNPFFNKTHSAESLIAISNTKSTGLVYVYDLFWKLLLVVSSKKMLSVKTQSIFATITSCIKSGDLFRGGWYFTSLPLSDNLTCLIDNQDSVEANALFDNIKSSAHIRKAVFVFDASTHEYIRIYNGVMECAGDLKISHNTIKKAMSTNISIDQYIFSGHRINKP